MPFKDPDKQREYDAARDRNVEPGYLRFKENRRLIYQQRKERQVCVDCEGDLEEDDGVRCKRCDGRDKMGKEIYRYTRKGRAAQKRSQRRYYRQRKKRDACVQCGLPRSEWPARVYKKKPSRPPKKAGRPLKCPGCMEAGRIAQARYRQRKKLGIVSLASERRKRDREKLRELRGYAYVPLDELLDQTTVQLLRGLKRFDDWTTVAVLFESIGVPAFDENDRADRDRFTQRLSYLVRAKKFVDRRKADDFDAPIGDRFEYQINEAGRAELARLLARSKAS